jgi:hypothetical protein
MAAPGQRPQIAPAGTPLVDPDTPSAPETAPALPADEREGGAGGGTDAAPAPDAPSTGATAPSAGGLGGAPAGNDADRTAAQPPAGNATPPAELLTRQVRVERSEFDAVRTAEVALGAAVLLLVAAAFALWYARRQGIIGR